MKNSDLWQNDRCRKKANTQDVNTSEGQTDSSLVRARAQTNEGREKKRRTLADLFNGRNAQEENKRYAKVRVNGN
jgi:hypothetical protein